MDYAPQPRWRGPRHERARSAAAVSSARERVFLGEQCPIAIERPRIKEADSAVIGLEGATRHTALIAQMKEIGANLLLTEHIGRAHGCIRPGSSRQSRQAACHQSYADATESSLFSIRVHTPGALSRHPSRYRSRYNDAPTAKPFSPTVDEVSKADQTMSELGGDPSPGISSGDA